MKIEEIRTLSDEQIVHAELAMERRMLDARFQHSTGQLDDTSSLARFRKAIARLRTVQRERELENGLSHNSLRDQHRSTFAPTPTEEVEQGEKSGGFLKGIVDKISGGE